MNMYLKSQKHYDIVINAMNSTRTSDILLQKKTVLVNVLTDDTAIEDEAIAQVGQTYQQ